MTTEQYANNPEVEKQFSNYKIKISKQQVYTENQEMFMNSLLIETRKHIFIFYLPQNLV